MTKNEAFIPKHCERGFARLTSSRVSCKVRASQTRRMDASSACRGVDSGIVEFSIVGARSAGVERAVARVHRPVECGRARMGAEVQGDPKPPVDARVHPAAKRKAA